MKKEWKDGELKASKTLKRILLSEKYETEITSAERRKQKFTANNNGSGTE